MRAIAFVAAIAAFLIAAPTANAAFGLAGFSAQPRNNDAGANSKLDVSFDVTDPEAGLRNLAVHLPPGLIGNPLATPTCSEAKLKSDACPAKSDVGDATNGVTVRPLGLPAGIPLTVGGQVYNVTPRKGEPARFGIVLDPAPVPGLGAALPKIILQQTATLRQNDFGLDTALKDIPRSAKIAGASTPLEVTSVALTLEGKVNGGKGFLRNPTSCGSHQVGFDATAYDGQTATGSTSFNTDNCAALPFKPKFSARIRQLTTDLANPVELTTSISQTIAEAGLRRAVVTLPKDIIGNGPALAIQCPAADFSAGNCAADTVVGNATAASPLQAEPLTGKVYLVTPTGTAQLPDLGVDLKGGLALKVKGSISATSELQIFVTFDGLPDIPLSDFSLTFAGGEGGLNVAGRDPCKPPPFVFTANFLSHAGGTRDVDADADASCPGSGKGRGKPKARVGIARLGAGKPKLSLRLRGGGVKIARAEVKLPRGLRLGPKRKLKRGTKAAGVTVRGRGRTLHLKVKGGGADRIRARLAKGAVRARSGVRAKRLKPFRIKIATVGGKRTKLSVRAR